MALSSHSHQPFPPKPGVGPAVAFGGPTPVSSVTAPPPQARKKDNLQAELAAMHAIGVALGQLTDPETRARVLRWAKDRFDRDRQATGRGAVAPPTRRVAEAAPRREPVPSGPAVVIHVASAEPSRLLISPAAPVPAAGVQIPASEALAGTGQPVAKAPAAADEPSTKAPTAVDQPATKAPTAMDQPAMWALAGSNRPSIEKLTAGPALVGALKHSDQPAPIGEDPLSVPTLAVLEALTRSDRPDPTVEDPLAVPTLDAIEAFTSADRPDPTGEDLLSVSNLGEFFEHYPRPVMRLAPTGRPSAVGSSEAQPGVALAAPVQPVGEMLRDLATDFQKIIDEWHSASKDT